MNKVVIKHKPC